MFLTIGGLDAVYYSGIQVGEAYLKLLDETEDKWEGLTRQQVEERIGVEFRKSWSELVLALRAHPEDEELLHAKDDLVTRMGAAVDGLQTEHPKAAMRDRLAILLDDSKPYLTRPLNALFKVE